MTSEIEQLARELAVSEWGVDLESLPEMTRFALVRRAIEDIRERTLRAAIKAAREQREELF